jgi:hypothetical protein
MAAPQPVTGFVDDALDSARGEVQQAYQRAQKGRLLLGVLPELLAENSHRRYLLAFQATGEARATGGVIGLHGVLDADDGRLSLESVASYEDLFPEAINPVDAPKWFDRNYGSQYATRQWQQVNSSPNFPVVSKVLLEMYQTVTGEELDGVVAMDPVALKDLLKGTGAITASNGDVIDAGNAVKTIMHDSYLDFGTREEQNAYLASLVQGFWKKIKEGDFDTAKQAEGIAEAVLTQHLKVFTKSRTAEDDLRKLDAAGFGDGENPNVQMVFHNAYAVNKVDYYLHRKIDTEIRITPKGEGLVTTTVRLHNAAPGGPASLLLGHGLKGDQPGLNRMLLCFLMPNGSTARSLTLDGRDVSPLQFYDKDYPVIWSMAEIPAGQTVEAVATYRVPSVVQPTRSAARFQIEFWPQPLVNADDLTVRVVPPSGFFFRDENGDAHSTLFSRGSFSHPLKLEAMLEQG